MYIAIAAITLTVLIILYSKYKKNKFNPEVISMLLSANINNTIHDSFEFISSELGIEVRNIFQIESNNTGENIEKFKVFQSYAFVKSFFFCESLLKLLKLNVVSADDYREIFNSTKSQIKETLPDFKIDMLNTNIKNEFE
ncbi:MAG: hypothetical protein GQ578_06895, partial [Desulfuromonadaceae bacterium]|nr:hypothetical protein [Desulfuromonadaceae bacterium]